MILKTVGLIVTFALGILAPLAADAQQPKKVPRIGYLATQSALLPRDEAFRQVLRDLGYVEGKSILIEYRYADGKLDRMPGLVTELVQLKPDVLVVSAVPAIRAAKEKTKSIPIVIITTIDPVSTGIVESLARPGGNITGLAMLTRDLSAKRLELLMEVLPGISRVAVLWDANAPGPNIAFKEYEAGARAMNIHLQSLEVRRPNPDLEGALQAAAKGRARALITIRNPLIQQYTKQIAELAIKTRLPSMHEAGHFVEAGGLISYSADDVDQWRRAAYYVDKILKGTKPSDLPVEQPTKFELVINLKTAKALGLTIPQSVLFRADRVIQ